MTMAIFIMVVITTAVVIASAIALIALANKVMKVSTFSSIDEWKRVLETASEEVLAAELERFEDERSKIVNRVQELEAAIQRGESLQELASSASRQAVASLILATNQEIKSLLSVLDDTNKKLATLKRVRNEAVAQGYTGLLKSKDQEIAELEGEKRRVLDAIDAARGRLDEFTAVLAESQGGPDTSAGE